MPIVAHELCARLAHSSLLLIQGWEWLGTLPSLIDCNGSGNGRTIIGSAIIICGSILLVLVRRGSGNDKKVLGNLTLSVPPKMEDGRTLTFSPTTFCDLQLQLFPRLMANAAAVGDKLNFCLRSFNWVNTNFSTTVTKNLKTAALLGSRNCFRI